MIRICRVERVESFYPLTWNPMQKQTNKQTKKQRNFQGRLKIKLNISQGFWKVCVIQSSYIFSVFIYLFIYSFILRFYDVYDGDFTAKGHFWVVGA